MKITKEIVENHGLKPDEYTKIKQLLSRDPNFLELGIFSAMWNEHCSYKSSKIHLKKLPVKNKNVIRRLLNFMIRNQRIISFEQYSDFFQKLIYSPYNVVGNKHNKYFDEFYDFKFGNLPYRSIKFKHSITESDTSSGHVTINYSDSSKHTRETWWHNIPGHHLKSRDLFIKTQEEPCDYKDNNYERYYPVKTPDDRFGEIYKKYRNLKEGNIEFIGRCGTYQYLDMHQVVNQSLLNVNRWIKDHE